MQKQISGYIRNYLFLYLCGYRKGSSSQQAFMSLKVLYKQGFGRAVLMDLSKAFGKLKHDHLLIAKRYAYGFNKEKWNFSIINWVVDGTGQK